MRKSFSMIEMLGVIIVIMILAGLLFPTISSIIDQGNKTKTHAKIVALKTAIMSYKSTYGYLPFTPQFSSDWWIEGEAYRSGPLTDDSYLGLMACLCADLEKWNPREVKFLDAPMDADGYRVYEDAWGKRFNIAFDLSYDNWILDDSVYGYNTPPSGDQPLPSELAIWSSGSDEKHAEADAAAVNDDNIVSWKE